MKLAMKNKPADYQVTILYLGTASYDEQEAYDKQVLPYEDVYGCKVLKPILYNVDVWKSEDHKNEVHQMFETCDVILISGGNTLYAGDRWRHLGIDVWFRDARNRGCVLAGGSAGAISWFDTGHSDSMNPYTYKRYELDLPDKIPEDDPRYKTWKYIHIPAHNIMPGC